MQVSKHEKRVELTERLTVIINMVDNEGTVKAKNKVEVVNYIPSYKSKKTVEDLSKERDEVVTANDETLEIDWKKRLIFSEKIRLVPPRIWGNYD